LAFTQVFHSFTQSFLLNVKTLEALKFLMFRKPFLTLSSFSRLLRLWITGGKTERLSDHSSAIDGSVIQFHFFHPFLKTYFHTHSTGFFKTLINPFDSSLWKTSVLSTLFC